MVVSLALFSGAAYAEEVQPDDVSKMVLDEVTAEANAAVQKEKDHIDALQRQCKNAGGKWKGGKCDMPLTPQERCEKNGGDWNRGKCDMPSTPQDKCKKKNGDWKRGKCVMPPPPPPEPKPTLKKSKIFSPTVGVESFLKLADGFKGRSFKTDPSFSFYCEQYGVIAVRQAQRRIEEGCTRFISLFKADAASQWSLNAAPQKQWCLTVSSYATEKETIFRERKLQECLSSQH